MYNDFSASEKFTQDRQNALWSVSCFEEFGSDAGFIAPISGWHNLIMVLIAEVIAVQKRKLKQKAPFSGLPAVNVAEILTDL
jgi:predicted NACHT family NTPase